MVQVQRATQSARGGGPAHLAVETGAQRGIRADTITERPELGGQLPGVNIIESVQ